MVHRRVEHTQNVLLDQCSVDESALDERVADESVVSLRRRTLCLYATKLIND